MKGNNSERIDIFCHILPQGYREALFKRSRDCYYLEADRSRPALWDLDLRFRAMDRFEGLRQVLTIGAPPAEYAFNRDDAVDLCRLANDEMAELLDRYPDRFVAAAACLPMNDMDETLKEAERALRDLNFKGVQLYSSINGSPLDAPQFTPLFEIMVRYDLPIWIHPARDRSVPDYPEEKESLFNLNVLFGWPFETTLAMARLVFGGVLERFSGIKFIAHHCGAMIPFFANRILAAGQVGKNSDNAMNSRYLSRPTLDYFKMFYGDTVLNGNTPGLMCGYAFFGPDNLLFGTDYPYPGGPEGGDMAVDRVIQSVEEMGIPEEEKARIFQKNAKRILKLEE
jgi:aminocarboxymuconate-semialdehyde decarboxylase